MKSFLNILIVVLTFALLFVLIYPQYEESRTFHIKMAVDSTIAPVIFYVASDTNFFKKENIKPEFVYYQNPEEGIEKIFSGEVQVGIFPWLTIFKRISEKKEVLPVFASTEFQTGITVDAIVAHPKSKIAALKDLRGKKIGLPFGYKDVLSIILKLSGLDLEKIQLIEDTDNNVLAKLLRKELDAALLIEPQKTIALKEGMFLVFDGVFPKLFVPQFPGFAIGFNSEFLNKKRRIAAKFKRLTDASIAIVNKDAHYARRVLGEYFKMEEEVFNNVRLPEFQKTTVMNKIAIMGLWTRLSATGIFKTESELDTTALFIKPYLLQI